MPEKTKEKDRSGEKTAREDRLAEALRANLRRRKAQATARKSDGPAREISDTKSQEGTAGGSGGGSGEKT